MLTIRIDGTETVHILPEGELLTCVARTYKNRRCNKSVFNEQPGHHDVAFAGPWTVEVFQVDPDVGQILLAQRCQIHRMRLADNTEFCRPKWRRIDPDLDGAIIRPARFADMFRSVCGTPAPLPLEAFVAAAREELDEDERKRLITLLAE